MERINKIKLLNDDECLACGRCIISCRFGAIKFVYGDNGNIEPYITDTKCRNCGACELVCKDRERICSDYSSSSHYIGRSKDVDCIYGGASGGLFYEISKVILRKGGCVFGATFDCHSYSVVFTKCETMDELKRIRKSKYVQSNWINVKKDIDEAIKKERWILVSGLPCQIDALRDLYGSYENALFVDVYCRGVIGARYFKEYLNSFACDIKEVDFRGEGKKINFTFTLLGENECVVLKEDCEANILYQGFANGSILKQKCFDCSFSEYKHCADITMGDFSDERTAKEKGLPLNHMSFFSTNTKKGEEVLRSISNELNYFEVIDNELIKEYYPDHRKQKGEWGYNLELCNVFKKEMIRSSDIKTAVAATFIYEMALINHVEKGGYFGDEIYIYGAGTIGRRVVALIRLLHKNWNVKCFIVTNDSEENVIDGLEIKAIDDITIDSNSIVLVAVSKKYTNDIINELRKRGIERYLSCE